MVLISLLLVALVCLVLGLVLASAGWLVASLAVTALAAFVLWSRRHERAAPVRPAAATTELVIPLAPLRAPGPDVESALDPGPEGSTDAGEVWVIDGQPSYHAAGCGLLIGPDAEPVPLAQATEDGFVPCARCDPDATVSGRQRPPAEPAPAAAADAVWVVDGRPRFHRSDCMIIQGQDTEPIPMAQASEDGFMPCSLCAPPAVSR